jgi:hypothetical protein
MVLISSPMKLSGVQLGEADLSARATHAHELARGLLLPRGEHDPERREHDIEACVYEGESFRIGFLKGDGHAFGFSPLAPAGEKRADIVG